MGHVDLTVHYVFWLHWRARLTQLPTAASSETKVTNPKPSNSLQMISQGKHQDQNGTPPSNQRVAWISSKLPLRRPSFTITTSKHASGEGEHKYAQNHTKPRFHHPHCSNTRNVDHSRHHKFSKGSTASLRCPYLEKCWHKTSKYLQNASKCVKMRQLAHS